MRYPPIRLRHFRTGVLDKMQRKEASSNLNRFLDLLPALVPAALILFLAFWLADTLSRFDSGQQAAVAWVPWLIFGVGLFIGYRFNRQNSFFALVSIGVAYLVLNLGAESATQLNAQSIFGLVAIVLPINLVIAIYLPQSNRRTWLAPRYFYLVGTVLVGWLAVTLFDTGALNWLYAAPFQSEIFSITRMPPMAFLLYTGVLLFAYGRAHSRPTLGRTAWLVMIVAIGMGLHAEFILHERIAFFGAAALILTVAISQESWSMAYLDPLTEIPGRRALDEALQNLPDKFAIAMVDIDHFKKFNDDYGHDVGDEVLRMVAAQMKEIGGNGKSYRFGGEEFSIVFANQDSEAVRPHLEELRSHIADSTFELRKNERRRLGDLDKKSEVIADNISVTISIGVADSNNHQDPTRVIKFADEKLYNAKDAGRNQVC